MTFVFGLIFMEHALEKNFISYNSNQFDESVHSIVKKLSFIVIFGLKSIKSLVQKKITLLLNLIELLPKRNMTQFVRSKKWDRQDFIFLNVVCSYQKIVQAFLDKKVPKINKKSYKIFRISLTGCLILKWYFLNGKKRQKANSFQ